MGSETKLATDCKLPHNSLATQPKNGERYMTSSNKFVGSYRTRSIARLRKRVLIAAVTMSVAALGAASPALAEPKGIFKVFAQCPTSTPGVALCTFAQTASGKYTIGNTTVPINQTVTLQGGGIPTGKNLNEYFLVPAKNGESLSKTELNVPGGLLNLINCEEIKGEGLLEKLERGTCKAIFENKTTGVTATTELVANEKNPAILALAPLILEEETALTLPVRVHLKNPLLGNKCYIGSESSPIELLLTTGTTSPPPPNKPISGSAGVFSEEEEKGFGISVIKENTLVNNSFSAPEAEGCGELFSFLIDPILDSKIGLPSAAGKNTAILEGTLRAAKAEAVIASEKF
jgi:hypothetical protein